MLTYRLTDDLFKLIHADDISEKKIGNEKLNDIEK